MKNKADLTVDNDLRIKMVGEIIRGDTESPEDPMAVEIHGGKLWVTLRDGRTIGTPLAWYAALLEASPEDLQPVELAWSGIFWPALDEGYEIKWMLLGESESFD